MKRNNSHLKNQSREELLKQKNTLLEENTRFNMESINNKSKDTNFISRNKRTLAVIETSLRQAQNEPEKDK